MAPSRATTRLTALLRRTALHQQQRSPFQSPRGPVLRRSYQSYDHPPPPGIFSAAEQAILSAAYRHVPEHGFTQHTLSLGARDAGYLDISTNLLPEGPFSLIRYHLVTQRQALARRSESIFNSQGEERTPLPLPVPDKVERLTWERLLGNQEVNHRWQEALAVMAQPSHVPASLRELALLADEVYYLAGDTSVDPSWYTKRGSLSMIYVSSELFMTNDQSPGFGETRAFLQRRLDETSKVGSALGSVAQWVGFTASAGVNVLRSKGVRI
ncbi:ubiquinone biosynthesis protein COQ9 [Annulohypoxylon truncatum]|uniref:ubiquinone biosynthesis protein COQ9 n=1 Tax=Annulohypoxylon truncatum TaxID=327061 RepID=UPI0020075098|nr:ubiquinone biosynthesis protein COQ9 [Annulohypoxylon truncatum]KAI1204162.1 ubiquinone biosynthesis protein COQ9 [Annulohypoxylon truncatum]